MSRNKGKVLRSINGGCGNCGTPKASDVYHPTPVPKISHPRNPNPTILTSTSIRHERNSVSGGGGGHHYVSSTGKLSGSIAVEMKSENPYNDFKQSILQMIIDRDIYSTTDLRELLQCFLQLNLQCHHQLILKAFFDICQVDSPPSSLHDNVSVL